jgi:hypothetical protein
LTGGGASPSLIRPPKYKGTGRGRSLCRCGKPPELSPPSD